MSINYLDKIKVGDVIKLPEKKKRPQEYLTQLKDSIAEMAKRNNDYLGFNYFADDLKIKTSQPADLDFVNEREGEWSALDKKDKEQWLKDKEKNTSNITEIAISLLLDKHLEDRYIIARASSFDDYKNGADNILIDKESGDIVCGMDGIIGHQGDDGKDIKKDKLKKIMEKGGVNIQYGASLDKKGKIIPASCKNIPAFYLSLSKEDLSRLLKAYYSKQADVLEELFSKLINSIKEQLEAYNKMNLNENLRANLNKFKI